MDISLKDIETNIHSKNSGALVPLRIDDLQLKKFIIEGKDTDEERISMESKQMTTFFFLSENIQSKTVSIPFDLKVKIRLCPSEIN